MEKEEQLNILVIDDEEEAREWLRRSLERRGYFVVTAGDGEEGLSKIKEFRAQIVICDIMMPKIDGIEFLEKARKYNLAVEIIMITGQSNLDSCVKAIENGACGYLVKPVNIEDVLENISKAQRRIFEKKEMIQKALEREKDKS
ncbi:MAG: response regulator [Candidatus Omnitrophota bacterium]